MTYFEHDEQRIYFEESGLGDPVALLPGFTESGQDLSQVIDALAPEYRVIAIDLPGSGRSFPQPRHYTLDFYHRDALTVAALLSHLALAPAHLLDYSDGGEVALLIAISKPELVRSVLVWGLAGGLDVDATALALDAIYSVIDALPEELHGWSEHLKRRYGEATARIMTQSWVETSREIITAGGDISLSRASEIRAPTLILAGERDPFTPSHLVRALAASIPRGELIEVPAAGHALHEQHQDWFIETMLARLLSNSALSSADLL